MATPKLIHGNNEETTEIEELQTLARPKKKEIWNYSPHSFPTRIHIDMERRYKEDSMLVKIL